MSISQVALAQQQANAAVAATRIETLFPNVLELRYSAITFVVVPNLGIFIKNMKMSKYKYGWAAGLIGGVGLLGSVAVMWSGSTGAADASPPATPVLVAAADTTATPSAAGSDSTPVATMGSLVVRRAEVDQMIRSLPPAERDQIKANRPAVEAWVRNRLAQKALIAQAQAKGWAQRPEVKALADEADREIVFRTYLQSVSQVPANYPSDAELNAAYEQAKGKLVSPPLYRIAQIFIPAQAGNSGAVARARKEALEVAKQAEAPRANFDSLVKKYSKDSDPHGNDTGFLPMTQLVQEMRPVVAKLQKGGVSAPIESQAGFHILKLLDVRPSQTATLAQVHDKLRDALRQQRQQQMAQTYLANLLAAGTVSIDGATLNSEIDNAPH
jgi:peptidylprolyl isomerase